MRYENPLIARYASPQMAELWGAQRKFETWRRLWIALAEAQQELGLPITDDQLAEMRRHVTDIDWEQAAAHERRLRHDVMAHVHAFGDVCPQARPILHWGATSCFVTDNTDLMLFREALVLIRGRLVATMSRLADFARTHRGLACLGFTHLQPAQPTTVGKRACLWIQDLLLDLVELEHRLEQLAARSVQGTTGTQASFLSLLGGDHAKVVRLQQRVAEKMGFLRSYPVTGQTYPRKVDAQLLDLLSGLAQSSHKAATDLRLLAHLKELEEPFESDQIGSSAMAYKRNPMRCERICALARFVMSLQSSPAMTAATQWCERTLDDSANRRLVLPQAFLAMDAVLMLYANVAGGLVVYPQVMRAHLDEELPFLVSENILMAAVAAGGDRQQVHERLRQHSQAAAAVVKQQGKKNDLLERLAADPAFAQLDLNALVAADQLVGRAAEQVDAFLQQHVEPACQKYAGGDPAEGDVWL